MDGSFVKCVRLWCPCLCARHNHISVIPGVSSGGDPSSMVADAVYQYLFNQSYRQVSKIFCLSLA
eukprot:m.699528 g.699528  ORF g.699528 m.699528 type:complete len:65 (+) comp22905_c1_seq6:2039-2233(+)